MIILVCHKRLAKGKAVWAKDKRHEKEIYNGERRVNHSVKSEERWRKRKKEEKKVWAMQVVHAVEKGCGVL